MRDFQIETTIATQKRGRLKDFSCIKSTRISPVSKYPVWNIGCEGIRSFSDRRFLLKRHLAITLSVIITALSFGLPVTATAQSTTGAEKIRTKVQTLSASKNSLVQVKFRDQTKVKGYIDSVEPVSFKLRDAKDGTSQSIAYAEVDSVSKASDGVSTKTWLILGGVAAGAVTTWLIVKPAICDGGAQSRGPC